MNNIAEKDSLLIVNNKTREDMRSRSLWNEHYTYTDYVFDTYGHETPVVSFTDRLLSQYFIDNAMKEVSVGIVRDINPVLSLSGAVKTNINNFSGTDTLTGLLANQLHAAALYNGSQINTLRRDNHMMNGQFISKNMDSVYGNTVSNISRLGSMLEISKETGRIPGEISENLGEVTFDKIENGIDNSVNFNTKYLAETLSHSSFYNPTSPYLNYDKIEGYSIEHNKKDNDTNTFNFDTVETEDALSFYNKPYSLQYYKEPSKKGSELTDYEQEFNKYEPLIHNTENSLLEKTNVLFEEHKAHTMIARFFEDYDTTLEFTDTAKTKKYGNSHGRNLLRKNGPIDIHGYDNPYCRTWTFHHQYDRLNKLIRPFSDEDNKIMTVGQVQELNKKFRSNLQSKEGYVSGDKYLANNTVLDEDNGHVNIVRRKKGQNDYKNCMFSIENLAWKDVPDVRRKGIQILDPSQRGANGGRIMWFPPYGLNFNEVVNAQWESYNFIGRGEPMFTYNNTTRSGNLSFYLIVDHPNIINETHDATGQNKRIKQKQGDGKFTTTEINDEDILRFFAGCSPLDIYEPKQTETPNPEDVARLLSSEIDYFVYVFFPNNYSGHMNNINNVDDDLLNYLLVGRNVRIPTNEVTDEYIGYEIEGTSGISSVGNTGVSSNPEDYIKSPYGEDYNFYYRVDNDLVQKLTIRQDIENCHRDIKSFGLNSNIENIVKQLNVDIDKTFTFVDFCCAVFELSNKTSTEEYKYIKEKSNESKVSKIKEYLQLETTSVTVEGTATDQDKKNSDKLSNRRCDSLKSTLNNILSTLKIENATPSSGENSVIPITGEDILSVNNIKPKASRYVKIKITVKTDAISEYENGTNGISKENAEKATEYYEYYQNNYNNDSGETDEFVWDIKHLVNYDHKIISPHSGHEYPEIYFNTFEEKNGADDGKITNDKFLEAYYNDENEYYKIIKDSYENYVFMDDSMNYVRVNNEIIDLLEELNKAQMEKETYEKDETICYFSFNYKFKYDYTSDFHPTGTTFEPEILIEQDMFEKPKEGEVSGKTNDDCEIELGGYSKIYQNILNELQDYLKGINRTTDTGDIDNEITEKVNKIEEIRNFIDTSNSYIEDNKFCKDLRNKTIEEFGKNIKVLEGRIQKELEKFGVKTCDYEKQNKELKELEKEYNNAQEEYNKILKKYAKGKVNKEEVEVAKETKDEALKAYKDKEADIKENACGEDANAVLTRFNAENITYNVICKNISNIFKDSKQENVSGATMEEMLLGEVFACNLVDTWDDIIVSETEEFKYFALDILKEEDEDLSDINKKTKKKILIALLMLERLYCGQICKLFDLTDEHNSHIYEYLKKYYFNDTPSENDVHIKADDLFSSEYIRDEIKKLMNEVIKYKLEDEDKSFTFDNIFYTHDNPFIIFKDDTKLKKDIGDKVFAKILYTQQKIIGLIEYEINTLQNYFAERAITRLNNAIARNNNNANNYNSISEKSKPLKPEDIVYDEEDNEAREDTRYEREDEYFMRLKNENPIIFKKLVDKFKYFDPGFHSISPEGFNARLTFLQQCTRQGQTIEMVGEVNATNNNIKVRPTAGNLSFGRMPVCILRIGDFINTRIIIESVSLNYSDGDSILLDLNPEGIGVQPMIAKVDLTIKILGGQSLEAPISKLQNALSFNYYANTGVYDNRSDRAVPFAETKKVNGEDLTTYGTNYTYVWSPLSDNIEKNN